MQSNTEDKIMVFPDTTAGTLLTNSRYLLSFRNISNGVISGSALAISSWSSSAPFFSRSWAPFCFKTALNKKTTALLSTERAEV